MTRSINDHVVNPANDLLTIRAIDEPGAAVSYTHLTLPTKA